MTRHTVSARGADRCKPFRRDAGNEAQSPDLVALARRIERLAPSHRDPEAFHVERDDIAKTLRRMARG